MGAARMNTKETYRTIEGIYMLIHFFCAYSIAVLNSISLGELSYELNTYYIYGMCFFSFFLLTYLIQPYIKHVPLYVGLHGIYFLIAIFLPTDMNLKMMGGCMVIILLVGNLIKQGHQSSSSSMEGTFYMTLLLICNVICLITNQKTLGFIISIMAVVSLLLLLIAANMKNLYHFVQLHQNKANVPLQRLVTTNGIFLGFYSLLSVATILLFLLLSSDALVNLIKYLIHWFLSLFQRGEIAEQLTQESSTPWPTPSMSPELNDNVLSYIIQVLLFLITIGGIVFILYLIYKRITAITLASTESDIIEYVGKQETWATTAPKKKPLRSLFIPKTMNEKIRYKFKQTIEKQYPKNPVDTTKTSKELLTTTLPSLPPENLSAFNNTYDKARYSNTTCTKEDLHAMSSPR